MLKTALTPFLPLLLLFGSGTYPSATRLNHRGPEGDTGTLEKLIAADGSVAMDIDLNRLNGAGSRPRMSRLRFATVPNSFFTILVFNDELRGPVPSALGLVAQNSATLPAPLNASARQLVIERTAWGEPVELVVRDAQTGFVFFNVDGQEYDYDAKDRVLSIKAGRLRLTKEFAAELGRPSAADSVVGNISITATMRAIEVTRVANGEIESNVLPAAGTVPGPDVIVGDLSGLAQFSGSSGTQVGLAVGTDSCNAGTVQLDWFASPSNNHPVIPQNLYRMSGGATNDERFEQVGQSSVKHAFTALQNNLCGFGCVSSGTGTRLGSGCSDPYSASLNSGNSGNTLGSRAWINPFNGAYPRGDSATPPNSHTGHTHTGPSHRVLVEVNDLNTTLNPGASYYAEAQYVTPHEYVWCQANPGQCNMYNNVSYRRYNVTGTASPFSFSPGGSVTVREKPAVAAWTNATSVQIEPAPGADGIGVVAYKVTNPSPGVWHYEYALYNQNLDRAIQSFSVPVGAGVTVSNVGFHAPPQHPGWANDGTVGSTGYSSAPWAQTLAAGALTLSSETFAQNQNANAIRWGTLYNVRFDSNRPPTATNATVGFFKTGAPISVPVQGPSAVPDAPNITATKTDSFSDPNADGKADPGQTITYTVVVSNAAGAVAATGVVFNDTVDPNTTLTGPVNVTALPGGKSPSAAQPSEAARAPRGASPNAVSVNIGTLAPGSSVTITFQATVNNPYPGGANVSNQGTVSGTNFANVLTDDTALGGTTDPTLTPIALPNILARDGVAAEPTSGTSTLLFTVTLSTPAGAGISVNYATAGDAGGANPATGGISCSGPVDYMSAGGTLNFAAGEQIKTVSVNLCADAVSPEANETLLLNLSGAAGGTLLDAQAVGTITAVKPTARVVISELRTSGPGGAGDDFVELYNNQDVAQDISGWSVVKSGAGCGAMPVVVGVVPAATSIPARGHYLVVGPTYGLTGSAAGDPTVAPVADIEADRNVALFNTSDVLSLSTATREDAVGSDANAGGDGCQLLREGASLPAVGGSLASHSFARRLASGRPQDTGDNGADFVLVSTSGGLLGGAQSILGAPGPENTSSPVQRNSKLKASLIEPQSSASAAPNRVRDFTPVANGAQGTLSIRRRVTNNTGALVTLLRFRIVDVTTLNSPGYSPGGAQADLRAIDGSNFTATTSLGTMIVRGTIVEQPTGLEQPSGGGWHSTYTVVIPGGGLAAGASTNVHFLLGVQQSGNFVFLINVEALPAAPSASAGAGAQRGEKRER